ncbi:hypothetical protein [uncultured Methanobrevibacter sp.]|uniref:hypothetical protein n=1 Tax=uncultured Methanobrevibacter sp. TaxID=253161 RepID=UPI0025F6177C|nr:hypothetical protein [uncultured Methanobrevibacter sp.]
MTLSGFNSAILNYGTLFIINCTFVNNCYHTLMDVDYGGAIKNYGGVYCYNSTFTSNKASKGAAIYSEGVSAQGLFVNCDFSKNQRIDVMGKMIYLESNFHITRNSVIKLVNCSGVYASTIHTEKDGLCLIRDTVSPTIYNVVIDSVSSLMRLSNLVNNNDEYDIINVTFEKGDYMVFPDSKVLFEMDYGKLIINGNDARVFVLNPNCKDETQFLTTTLRSYVVINGLVIEGFNIAIENSGYLEIYNSIFYKNEVDYLVKDDYGGAIVNDGSLYVFNSTFKSNWAKYGGAIYNTGYACIIDSSFISNVGYNNYSDTHLDIYNHEGNIEIISLGGAYPKTIEHFPIAQWKENLYLSITYAVSSAILTATGAGLKVYGVPHWAISIIGGIIGGSFGTVTGAIYSEDHQDYSSFWTSVFAGVTQGMDMTAFGEDYVDYRRV